SRTARRSDFTLGMPTGGGMAKRSRTEITESLRLISWLYWQVLRRQPRYIAAVGSCIQQCTGLENSVESGPWFAAKQVVSVIRSLEQYCWTGDPGQDEVAISMMVDDGLRFFGSLPEFKTWEQEWRIRFPIPPSIPELPSGEFLTSPWCVPV